MAESQTRQRSGAVFGNEKFLEVVLVIDREAPIHSQAIAKRLGVASALVTPVLNRLQRGGLIRIGARPVSGSAKPYEPIRSTQAWPALVNLCLTIQERETLF